MQINTNNSQSEMYLTDIVGIAVDSGRRVGLMICRDNREVIGINSPRDLQSVESLIS
jgi:bifunctional UDP-N-acetylglucosamine pyrophosphorylase/glucosamine-1-phosphate N-acetyltransferase